MKNKKINFHYHAVEKLVQIIEAEKEEPNQKKEYEIYLEKAEEGARRAEAAARREEAAARKAEVAS